MGRVAAFPDSEYAERMASDISPDSEQYIEQAIAGGLFRSRAEAIDAGVHLLKQRDDLVARLRESRRQLNDGECVEFDDAGIHNLFVSLKQRARQQSSNEHGS